MSKPQEDRVQVVKRNQASLEGYEKASLGKRLRNEFSLALERYPALWEL